MKTSLNNTKGQWLRAYQLARQLDMYMACDIDGVIVLRLIFL